MKVKAYQRFRKIKIEQKKDVDKRTKADNGIKQYNELKH